MSHALLCLVKFIYIREGISAKDDLVVPVPVRKEQLKLSSDTYKYQRTVTRVGQWLLVSEQHHFSRE